MRVIDLNRKPGEAVPAYRPMPERVECDSPPWVKAREKACAACDRQTVHGFEERCELRPDWGCLGKARHRRDRECPEGRWGKASMRELKRD